MLDPQEALKRIQESHLKGFDNDAYELNIKTSQTQFLKKKVEVKLI
jgi:hypothetical protein